MIDAKPRHWRAWYDGAVVSNFEAPLAWVPATLTGDQVREVNARNAVEVELIDEAIGRVMAAIAARGWDGDVDVVVTTDHGELQGDFGLLVQGAVPRRCADAAAAGVAAGAVERAPYRRPSPGRSGWSTWPRRSAPSPACRRRRGWRGGRSRSTTSTPTPVGSSGC